MQQVYPVKCGAYLSGVHPKGSEVCVWIKGFGIKKTGGMESWNNGTLAVSLTQYSNNPVFHYSNCGAELSSELVARMEKVLLKIAQYFTLW